MQRAIARPCFDTDVDECADNNGGCSQFATCINVPDSFNCTCNTGYTGDGFTCSGMTFIWPIIVVSEINLD